MYNNFTQLKIIGETVSDHDSTVGNRLMELGIFAQEIECQLSAGFVSVYPNIRILLEGLCDFLLDYSLGLEIKESYKGNSFYDIRKMLEELDEKNEVISGLKNKTIFAQRDAFSIALKVDTINKCLREKGVDTSSWKLHDIRRGCSKKSHTLIVPLTDDKAVIRQMFVDRFTVLKVLYEGLYSHLVKLLLGLDNVTEYHFPNKHDFNRMVMLYRERVSLYQ